MTRRIAVASVLIAVSLGVPCVYLWVTGLAAAEAERSALLAAPTHAARAAAARIATRVMRELNELAEREGERPYYEWQSLIVDPRGAYEGEAVVPSPLAAGPSDPLVLSHFQIDMAGTVTSPEVNEAKGAPEASPLANKRLDELRTALSGRRVEVLGNGSGDASASGSSHGALGNEDEVQAPIQVAQVQQRVQEQRVSNAVYQQNANAPEIFEKLQQKSKKGDAESYGPGQVTVRVGDFAWESMALGGREMLAATRLVETPDAPKRQGFVVAPGRLASLLVDGAITGRIGAATGDVVDVPLGLPGLATSVVVSLPDRAALEVRAAEPIADFYWRTSALTLFALIAAAAILALVVHAERLSERRQHFAAAAAHELRTPLAGLRMYAEMLAHGLGKPEKQKAYAERLASEAARLGRVVSNVLDFTRLERKSLAVNATTQDVAAAVSELVKQLEPSIAIAGAKLVLERPDAPVMAAMDVDALAQIVGNLIDNAEKYTRGSEDRTISVSVRQTPTGAEVSVRDRGPGLPKRLIKRKLFQAFARGTPSDGPAGLGLGLALARALARAQGGELVASTSPSSGAELIVTLPNATATNESATAR